MDSLPCTSGLCEGHMSSGSSHAPSGLQPWDLSELGLVSFLFTGEGR